MERMVKTENLQTVSMSASPTMVDAKMYASTQMGDTIVHVVLERGLQLILFQRVAAMVS